METFRIATVTRDGRQIRDDRVTEEIPLTIDVNDREIATLLASPTDIEELVVGFLFTTGLVPNVSAVASVSVDDRLWKAVVRVTDEGIGDELAFKRVYTSGCGRGIIYATTLDLINRIKLPLGFSIESARLFELVRGLLTGSEEHVATGGVHSAALADEAGIVVFRDDIGRHNAVDKVVGWALKNGVALADTLLLTSGRISSEILGKALRCRIPMIVSPGAPTNQAVRLAREGNLTLIAHARGGRMNIYSGSERVRSGAYIQDE
jgi:FdhD protein